MGKLKAHALNGLIEKPGRYADGDGLFFKTRGQGRSYWTYRFSVGGKETERSLGPYPEVSLDEARKKHFELRKRVIIDKVDPVGEGRFAPVRAAVAPPPTSKRLFREMVPDLTHLYRQYGFDGQLLYVGVSHNTVERWGRHRRQTWADRVATITIEHYPTRETAEAAEAEAIIAERPRFNGHVVFNSPELAEDRAIRRNRKPAASAEG